MEKKGKNNRLKITYLLAGLLISLLFSVLVFHPQPGFYGIIGTAFSVMLYGYTWIIPIVGLTIGLSNDKSFLRIVMRNKNWIWGLSIICIITLIVSWSVRFSNDLFFFLNWLLTTLLWLSIYFRLKIMSVESTYGNNV